MNIKVLGPGCAKCQNLEKTVKDVVTTLKLDIQVEEVKDMQKIMKYPILMTPGLVINEKVVLSGKVPSRAEVEQLIISALDAENRGSNK
ncbi:MAG: TM0996/MTH895 family glutaredoxin-like protein [Dehalococcoidia bacterium]|nr:TM0996/MTH895 family glutaredoxin-like protein [Dehalococcoidia bacterium]